MKRKGLLFGIGLMLVLSSGAHASAELAKKYNCAACHAPDRKILGPSWQDVSKKYAGDAAALARLQAKVKSGGAGVWGQIPMPPNTVPDADLKALIGWALAGGK